MIALPEMEGWHIEIQFASGNRKVFFLKWPGPEPLSDNVRPPKKIAGLVARNGEGAVNKIEYVDTGDVRKEPGGRLVHIYKEIETPIPGQ